MVRCPNCGQETSGIDSCEWCKYPLLRGSGARRRKAQEQAERETKLAAQEEKKRKAEEARKTKEAQEQAKSWDHPRRVVAKVEWHQGQLFP